MRFSENIQIDMYIDIACLESNDHFFNVYLKNEKI